MYVMGDSFGWGTSGTKMTTNTSAKTATYTTTSDVAANVRWKVASGDYEELDLKNTSDYIFKYADGSVYDGTISLNDNAITVSKVLPSGTVITYSYDSKKATVTVPKASTPTTISKVEIFNKVATSSADYRYASFTKKSDDTWALAGFTTNWAENNNTDKTRHRIRVTLSDNSTKEYTAIEANNQNYWVGTGTHSMVEVSTGYFCIKKPNQGLSITLKFNGTTLSSMTLSDEAPATPKWVNMPLKPSDFAGGKAHYFLVGFRTAGWRLQPEWELTQTAANTYALPANQRLMYNQYFGIAKVSSYDDYIHQRYTMYYDAEKVVTTDNVTIALDASRTNPVTSAVNNKSNSMLWSRTLNWGNPNTANMDESTIRWSYPSVLTTFQITVNASTGDPTMLKIVSTQTPAEVVKHRAFTLVGGEIKSNTEYDINGTKKTIGQATYNATQLNMTGWQNPWVQYDADGNPYIDGNGHAVYHTAFDAHYLTGHPSKFDYKLGDGTTFSYNSNRITFVDASTFSDEQLAKDEYADLYKMFAGKTHDFTDNGAHSNGNFQYTEIWKEPGYGWANDGKGNSVTTNSSYTHDDWKCFVVKDMWVKGKFKIWSGWGGNIKDSECIGADEDKNSARWFPANGGHATIKTVKPVHGGHVTGENAKIDVYGMRMDVEGADFQIEGSDDDLRYYKRVILWYPGGQCGFNSAVLQLVIDEGGPTIQARCTDNKSFSYRWNIPQGGTTEDVVDSYTIIRRNTETGQTVTVKKETGLSLTPADYVNFTTWFTDDKAAQPGEYEYEITIHYKNSDITKSAISNPVHIFAEAQPVLLKAEQYMEGDLYSFDLVLTPTLRENELNRTANSKTGLDMAKEVRIWSDDEFTKQAMGNMREAALPDGWLKKDDGYYYTLPVERTGLTILPITLCDIAPNAGLDGADDKEYTFNVELTSDDTNWSTLAYVKAPAAASIYAPSVDIHLSQPTVAKIETATGREDIAKLYAAVDRTLLPAGWYTNDYRIENPALYTRFNEVRAAATIDPLKVTPSVKGNWDIKYNVTVNGNLAESLTGTPTDVTIHGLPANTTGVSAKVAVSYARNGGASYNALVQPGTSQEFNHSFAEPTFTPKEQTWFQRNYAEPNNASPANNRTLAFAQFDGTVGGFDPNLNYYVDYNFTADGVEAICEELKSLKSTGTDTEFKDQYLFWGVFNGKAASGGRVIGKRPAGAGPTNGSKFVDELPFDYLYYNHADNAAYINEWTLANSWTDALIAEGHRLPVEVGPIAVAAAYGDDITLSDVNIKGSVDIIYPILEGIAITDETPAPASAQQRAGAAEAAATYAPAEINLANVKTIKSEVTGETPISIAITNDKKVTGIDEISADAITLDGDAEIYNLQGIRIYKPAPGNVYIVRRGTSVAKVLCK